LGIPLTGDGSVGKDWVHANALNSSLPSAFSLLSCVSSIITAQQVSVALSFIPISPFSSLHVLLLSLLLPFNTLGENARLQNHPLSF